jgi:hypothetical protein
VQLKGGDALLERGYLVRGLGAGFCDCCAGEDEPD